MTPERLAEIEARAKAAKPGPWNVFSDATIMSGKWHVTEACRCIPGYPKWVNAAFIASSREDIPDLIAALREAWRERDDAAVRLSAERDDLLRKLEPYIVKPPQTAMMSANTAPSFGTGDQANECEPFEREGEPGVWSVEQIGEDGEIHQAIFCGPESESRCREYARFKL